ncbi:hypothetical protein ACQF36_13840 [Streptomyces sp. Marseille-Q5077]|uniref:hypothetical protein n=1 Tax=Streptomyces sp. Marseille-Q5077 TaxID=3418995 RepID=UPI003D065137
MTAENEGRTGRDGYDEGRGGVDALMAAITGEPLTDEARADAAFMAEHRSAAADVALLREQLGIIGHALTEPMPASPAPERPRNPPPYDSPPAPGAACSPSPSAASPWRPPRPCWSAWAGC